MSAPPPRRGRRVPRLPRPVFLLAAGTFLMGTSEYVVAGVLPELAADVHVSVAVAGLTITVFAVGIIIGSPLTALLTLRLPRRSALVVALGGGMLANALGVPLGSFAGQQLGWRSPMWALALLALAAAAALLRFLPAESGGTGSSRSVRAEIASLRAPRLRLVLMACVGITAGVFPIYSFVSPLLTEGTGLRASSIPLALVAFGLAACAGSLLGGRLGGTHPYPAALGAAAVSLCCAVGLAVALAHPVPTLALFTLLGLSGFLANPIMFVLVIRFSGSSPTLPTALASSMFNVGIAVSTAIAAGTVTTGLGVAGPAVVGALGSASAFLPLGTLAVRERRPSASRRR